MQTAAPLPGNLLSVVYLIEQPMSRWNFERFGIGVLQANGFDVRVFDLTQCFAPEVHEHMQVTDPYSFDGLQMLPTEKDILTALARLDRDKTVLIVLIPYDSRHCRVYRAISDLRLAYANDMSAPVPVEPAAASGDSQRLLSRLRRLTPAKLCKALRMRYEQLMFRRQSGRIAGSTLWLLGGGEGLPQYDGLFPRTDDTELLWIHNRDYDAYLAGRDSEISEELIVYVDGYDLFHPDYLYDGSPAILATTPEVYYGELVKFLGRLEERFQLPTEIAAHPRSCYEDMPDYFGGRPVRRNTTAELIQRAKIVVTHSSTAINIAVLYHKPVVFITSRSLSDSYLGSATRAQAAELDRQVFNLDAPVSDAALDAALSVDRARYARYVERFVKQPGTAERPFWQVVADRLKMHSQKNFQKTEGIDTC